tara:strand:- start:696 stop:908 length:213 start_codon:yes stop_codon:yes gene_type:complete
MVKVKDKKYKKLLETKKYLDKKVSELTKDRKKDRSWDAKATLVRLKKQKLRIKEELSKLADKFSSLTNRK